MRKGIILFLISFLLSFNMLIVTSVAQTTTLKEGFYTVTELNFSPDKDYTIQNISFADRVQVFIFDDNQIVMQTIRLRPQSPKYDLQHLESNYKILIVGDGDVVISEKKF